MKNVEEINIINSIFTTIENRIHQIFELSLDHLNDSKKFKSFNIFEQKLNELERKLLDS